MKVIGTTQQSGEYIAIVNHTELEKLTDKYYGKLSPLKVGEEMDLGAGYDFKADIVHACKQMQDAVKAFNNAQTTMLKFAVMVGQLPAELPEVPSA